MIRPGVHPAPPRARRSRAAALGCLLSLLAAGCRDLSPLEADVCGNRVTEPEAGEDCDGQDGCGEPGQPAACRFTCGDGVACPAPLGCGVDGVCRRPSGRFSAVLAESTPSTRDLLGGDVDGDGCAELLRVDRHGVELRAFESHAAGACAASVLSFDLQRTDAGDPALPAPLLVDVTGDGLLDLIAPADGPAELGTGVLLASGGEGPTLSPLLEPLIHLDDDANTRLVRARLEGADALVILAGDAGTIPPMGGPGMGGGTCGGPIAGGATLRVLVAPTPDAKPTLLGELPGAPDGLAAVLAVDLDGAGDCEELVLALGGDDALRPVRLCAAAGGLSVQPLPPVALPAGVFVRPRTQGLAAVDVDGDGRVDLVANATDGALHVAYGLGGGAFGASPSGPADQQTGALAADPALSSLDAIFVATGPGLDDLVPVACPVSTPFTSPLCPPVAATCQALAADVDADGDLDVISIEGQQPGVTVRRRLADGAFHAVVLDTRCIPSRIAAADVDGDGVGDVVFFDQATSGDGSAQTVVRVAYGAAFAPPEEPVTQGSFPRAVDLVAGRFGGALQERLYASSGTLCADPMMQMAQGSALAVLEGRAERVLLAPAYFPPPMESAALSTPLSLRALVVARLGATGMGGASSASVAAVSHDETGVLADALWPFAQEDLGIGATAPLEGIPACDDCVVVPLDRGGATDDLLFLGAEVSLYAVGGGAQSVPSSHAFVAREGGPPAHFVPRPLVADLDGDGWLDVLARASNGELVAFWGAAEGLEETTLRASGCLAGNPGPDGEACGPLAFAWLDVDGDGATELVLADGVTLRAHRLSARALDVGEALTVARAVAPPHKGGDLPAFHDYTGLAAADFDGDGVVDLALASSSSFYEILRGEPVRE